MKHSLIVPPELCVTVEQVKRHHAMQVLEHCHGHRTRAAQILGIDRKTLFRCLQKWAEGSREMSPRDAANSEPRWDRTP